MNSTSFHLNRFRIPVIASAIFVLLWRSAAFQWPSTFVKIPEVMRLPLMLMGLLFLICGLLAWRLRPGRWTGVFLLYGLGGAVHWGGAIGSESASIELMLFFVYLSWTALSDAALLHLALIFPSGRTLGRIWTRVLYFPAGLALLLAPVAGFASQTILKNFALLILLISNLLSILAGVLFLVSSFRADSAARRAAHLPLIAGSFVLAGVLALLGEGKVLPGLPDAWNLPFALIPLSLTFSLTSPARSVLAEWVEAESSL